jgi:hypothetical protein
MNMSDATEWLKMAVQDEDADVWPRIRWKNVERPGYFGKRRDLSHARYDQRHGRHRWRLRWLVVTTPSAQPLTLSFEQACKLIYEESYFRYLQDRPDDLDFICEFTDCIDNAPTNIHSGLDYTAQEASSTHIQDIAVRNVLARLGRTFTGNRTELLVIRSADSNGYRFGPGNVPLFAPDLVMQPSLAPSWANPGTVEDFWQSNKWLQVHR